MGLIACPLQDGIPELDEGSWSKQEDFPNIGFMTLARALGDGTNHVSSLHGS